MVANLVTFENFGSLLKILQTAVGAGADDNLVNFDCMTFLGRMGVFRQMRISNNGNKLVELNIEYAGIFSVFVGSNCFPFTGYAAFL